jgi:hypothetical protein
MGSHEDKIEIRDTGEIDQLGENIYSVDDGDVRITIGHKEEWGDRRLCSVALMALEYHEKRTNE